MPDNPGGMAAPGRDGAGGQEEERDSPEARAAAARAAFNEGNAEAIAEINLARERGEWPFGVLPRPGADRWECPVCGLALDRADGSVDAHCAGSKLEGTAHERTRMVATGPGGSP